MASSISSLGIGSNLDLSGLLDSLKSSEQSRLTPLKTQQSSFKSQLSAYGVLQGALEQVQTASEALGKADLYKSTQVASESEAFKVEGSADAVPGRYSVDVDRIAKAQSLVSAGQAAIDSPVGQGGTITLSLGDGAGNVSNSVDIAVDPADSSLEGLRDAINGADIGVNASIINDGSAAGYRIVLSSEQTGTDSQISVAVAEPAGETALSGLLAYDSATHSGSMQETVAAENASVRVNGVTVESQSNTLEEAIQGVTVTLSGTTEQSETITSSRDDGKIKKAFETFVSAYNRLQSVSSSLTSYGGEDGTNGVLIGDSTVRSIQTQLRGALNTPVEGSSFNALAQIGVSLQNDGTMEIDDDTFDAALADNRADVAALMSGDGSDENSGVAGMLGNALERLVGDNGLLSAAKTGTENRIDGLGDRMDSMQDSIDATIERYRQQFIELDSLMSSLNSTGNYLTQQLGMLNNNSSDNSN
ncbi:flagellar filament capping protein FliD [Salinisphaera aquimarina]|uniref:Flagellar hook-associated protein 2 n=1 Tax=Salinisphaera aquimarina TaxID=2094031 RepID=A0ABV7EQK8_9GAMM